MKINVTTNIVQNGVCSRKDEFKDQTDALIIEKVDERYDTLILVDTTLDDESSKEEIELEDGHLRTMYFVNTSDAKELDILLLTDDEEAIGLGSFIIDDNHSNYDVYFNNDEKTVVVKKY